LVVDPPEASDIALKDEIERGSQERGLGTSIAPFRPDGKVLWWVEEGRLAMGRVVSCDEIRRLSGVVDHESQVGVLKRYPISRYR
jgi:hypothetical protein